MRCDANSIGLHVRTLQVREGGRGKGEGLVVRVGGVWDVWWEMENGRGG